uniref:Uncharacterized protein n=1 Tax=Aplanochytrium stocchinoi TaxID=215587 RepID=A0A7S3PH59_9STRA
MYNQNPYATQKINRRGNSSSRSGNTGSSPYQQQAATYIETTTTSVFGGAQSGPYSGSNSYSTGTGTGTESGLDYGGSSGHGYGNQSAPAQNFGVGTGGSPNPYGAQSTYKSSNSNMNMNSSFGHGAGRPQRSNSGPKPDLLAAYQGTNAGSAMGDMTGSPNYGGYGGPTGGYGGPTGGYGGPTGGYGGPTGGYGGPGGPGVGGEFANAMGQFGQATGVNPAMMAMGAAATTRLMDDTMKNFAPGVTANVSGLWGTLKFHFSVDNNYVIRKLMLLLFPFRHREWKRLSAQSDNADAKGRAPPMLDINCPDFYIPTMAFVTYVLLLGLLKGTKMNFTPEVLGDTFSSSITTQFIEVLVIAGGNAAIGDRGGTYNWLELVIYTGYKYVGVALTMLSGMIFGYPWFLLVSLYTAVCSSFSLSKWLSCDMPDPLPKRSRTLLLGIAVLEFLVVFYLGYSNDFSSEDSFSFMAALGLVDED